MRIGRRSSACARTRASRNPSLCPGPGLGPGPRRLARHPGSRSALALPEVQQSVLWGAAYPQPSQWRTGRQPSRARGIEMRAALSRSFAAAAHHARRASLKVPKAAPKTTRMMAGVSRRLFITHRCYGGNVTVGCQGRTGPGRFHQPRPARRTMPRYRTDGWPAPARGLPGPGPAPVQHSAAPDT